MHPSGKPLFRNLYGGHKIEPQKRQIGKVIPGQFLAIKVGVDQSESLEARLGGSEPFKAGDYDLPPISADYVTDLSLSAYEDAYLPLYIA